MEKLNKYPENINIAVIGLGKMGSYHLNALKALQAGKFESYYKGDSKQLLTRIEICGICDCQTSRLHCFPDIPVFSDYNELFLKKAVDIAIVATPPETHFDIAKTALENGTNVFVEKPIVTKSDELEQLLKIAEAKKLKLLAGHIERYNPVTLKIREMLSDHNGVPKQFNFKRVQPHHPRVEDDIVIDKLIHDLDLALFLFGRIKNFQILATKKIAGKVQELKLKIEHENSTGEIFVSWLQGNQITRMLKLEAGNTLFEGDFLKKSLIVNGKSVSCEVCRWIEANNNQIKDELVDFIIHCFGKKDHPFDPLLSVDELLCTVRIVEDISRKLNNH